MRCNTEQECTYEPWCRIRGECGKTRRVCAERKRAMTLPRPWPFPSTDQRMVRQPSEQQEQQEPKLCECSGPDLSLAEMAAGKCETCGKPLIVEAE